MEAKKQERMRIADMLPTSQEITVGVGKITIRALDMTEMLSLFIRYRTEFVSLYVEGGKDEPNLSLFAASSKQMLSEIIAISSDRLDETDDIAKWPATTMLEVITAIWLLSVPDPKKFLEALNAILGQMKRLHADVQGAISTALANKSANSSSASSPPVTESKT